MDMNEWSERIQINEIIEMKPRLLGIMYKMKLSVS